MSSVAWTGVSWSRGLTRLYLVLWILWACHFLWLAIVECLGGLQSWTDIIWEGMFVLFVAGLVPAFLLLAIRWIFNGFGGRRRLGLHQVWSGQRWKT